MDKENELPKRKKLRLKYYDYSSTGAYFITVCTQNRQQILSKIVGTGLLQFGHARDLTPHRGVIQDPRAASLRPDCPQIQLTEYGKVLDKYINQMSSHYESITVDRYVIMPNHFHMILNVNANGQSGTPVPTKAGKSNSFVSSFVSTLKRFCNKEYGKNIWQSRFYDHVIRNREDYEEHTKYIYENPIQWYYDELYTEE
ncbi:MAG: transposase [Clostridia bacterium]|nr:transposase [Clostridia bacterium]